MKVKIKSLKFAQALVGQTVPPSAGGYAGRAAENMLNSMGVRINRGHGPDILGIGTEVKTRDLNSTSPQTVADMTLEEILSTPYEQSHVFEKIQRQLRIYIKENVIVSAEFYDFSSQNIQDKIKKAYNHAQAQLIANPNLVATSARGNFFGYFEKCSGKTSYSFRMTDHHYQVLEAMSRSTFNKFFD